MDQLPAAVVPIETRLEAFLESGGLMHVEEPTAERPGSTLRDGGGAVALLVELLSVHPNLSSTKPFAS